MYSIIMHAKIRDRQGTKPFLTKIISNQNFYIPAWLYVTNCLHHEVAPRLDIFHLEQIYRADVANQNKVDFGSNIQVHPDRESLWFRQTLKIKHPLLYVEFDNE